MSANFVIYLIGYIIAIIGVAYALSTAGVGQAWIVAAALILIGLGIVYAMSRSQRDATSNDIGTAERDRAVADRERAERTEHTITETHSPRDRM
jgi:hypothetical protein